MGRFQIKPGMLVGVADSAVQSLGLDCDNTWNDWFHCGNIKDGTDPSSMPGGRNRQAELAQMRDMGIQCYRFSVEWALIEPSEGQFDTKALESLREELVLIRTYGIEPMLTLHHFSNPLWFEARGGFEKFENIEYFLRFAEKTVRAVAHLVSDYVTINEPNIYALKSYVKGVWPPGKRSVQTAFTVLSVLAAAHIKCYTLIHDVRRRLGFSDTRVGVALNVRPLVSKISKVPKSPAGIFKRKASMAGRRFFQEIPFAAILEGQFSMPLTNPLKIKKGIYCDIHCINFTSGMGVGKIRPEQSAAELVKSCAALTSMINLPIFITSNGICTDDDALRIVYIYQHLGRLCGSALTIERYFYWSLGDMFEWNHGLLAKYGLATTDPVTGERVLKKSGEFYRRILKDGGVTQESFAQFVKTAKRSPAKKKPLLLGFLRKKN